MSKITIQVSNDKKNNGKIIRVIETKFLVFNKILASIHVYGTMHMDKVIELRLDELCDEYNIPLHSVVYVK